MTELGDAFLTHLERKEAPLLSWGYVDGAFTEAEFRSLADDFALDHDSSGLVDGAALAAEARRRRLVLELETADGVVYRTRSAETIRLLARLKQLFPKHRGTQWSSAAKLVADYRYLARPR